MKIPHIKDYPKKIYLKEAVYKIKFVKNLENLGETDPDKREIRIRKGMSRNETFRTMIHEVLHFMEFEWPFEIPHRTVYKLEEAVFCFLIDNLFHR